MLRSVVRRHRQLTRVFRDPCILSSCDPFSPSSRTYATPLPTRSIFNEATALPSGVCSFSGWKAGFSSALNAQEEGDDAESVESHKPRYATIGRALRQGGLSKVIRVFDELKAKEAQGVKSYLAVMRACSREGNMPMLIKFMKEMEDAGVPADKYVYNTYIHAFAKTGDLDGALEIFNQMQERSIPHDGVTYRSLMFVAGAGKNLEKAKEYFEEALKYEPNDVRNYNFMMTASDKAADESNLKESAETCLNLMEQLKEKKMKPDRHTYQHLMKACARAGMMEEAMKYLDEASSSGAGVRVVMYDILMEALGNSGLEMEQMENKLVELFKHMDSQKVRPTLLSLEHVIDTIGKVGNISSAMGVIDKLRAEGIKPAGVLSSAKLLCIKRMGEEGTSPEDCLKMATTVLNEMSGMHPSIPGYGFLFEIYNQANALDKALERWNDFEAKSDERRRADERIVEPLMQLYLKNDKTDEAVKMFDVMEKHGTSPRLETFHIILGHLAESGDKENAAKVHKKMLEAKVEPDEQLKKAMKTLGLD